MKMGGGRGGEGQDVRKRATKQDVLFSPVPPESDIKPLDRTGAHGEPTGYDWFSFIVVCATGDNCGEKGFLSVIGRYGTLELSSRRLFSQQCGDTLSSLHSFLI